MIALDTNILARFYVDDPGDPEAVKQRPIARRILMDSPSLFVPLTVTLELEWVLRAFYRFDPGQIVAVFEHLLGLDQVNTEEADRIAVALPLTENGIVLSVGEFMPSAWQLDELALA
jgi:predicted nucleic-acid-binding protein